MAKAREEGGGAMTARDLRRLWARMSLLRCSGCCSSALRCGWYTPHSRAGQNVPQAVPQAATDQVGAAVEVVDGEEAITIPITIRFRHTTHRTRASRNPDMALQKDGDLASGPGLWVELRRVMLLDDME